MSRIKEFCKKHKKAIICGCVGFGVVTGTILIGMASKNKQVLYSEPKHIDDGQAKLAAPLPQVNDVPSVSDKVEEPKKIINVSGFLRNLKEGQQHSPQNEEKARMAGITDLPKGVSYIPDYQKGIKSSLQ